MKEDFETYDELHEAKSREQHKNKARKALKQGHFNPMCFHRYLEELE